MRRRKIILVVVLTSLLCLPALGQITLKVRGTYATGIFDDGAAEIVAHDPDTQRLFVTNGADQALDVLDIKHPGKPTKIAAIDVSGYGCPTSVDVGRGVVAVAVENGTDSGVVVFLDTDGNYLNDVQVGAMPDMVTFTPDGTKVLVANEGEPNDEYTIDPEGSVSIIDISDGVEAAMVSTADFTWFDGQEDLLREAGVRIYGPGASASQDLEPEYIAVSADSETAWVTLQENNALAIVDIGAAEVTAIVALGYKDHLGEGNGLDASNKDDAINIANWPVRGLYLPDGTAAYRVRKETYIITVNEGDARDYGAYSEEARVKDLVLDPDAFPNAEELQESENLGRLKVTTADGDTDGDGDFDEIYSYGARSFSIWKADGTQVFDSGEEFEQITAFYYPGDFNSTDDENDSFDDRSDDKGPEPECVVVGEVSGRIYAFIGLERIGGIMIYDVSEPWVPRFVDYVNNRDFLGDPEAGTAGDLAPEGLTFIPKDESPNGKPLLVVANEVSGTTTIFAVVPTP